MSTPASKICICAGVRLTNRYDHTIYFESKAAQTAYFQSKVVKTFTDYTYLRKQWSIKVDATLETARTWSYLFFNNASGKTWYYFITDVQYKNDNTVELSLELDVMQTYAFDYTLLRSFVDREHATTDTIGSNTVEEGLETGDYVDNGNPTNAALTDFCIMIQSTIDLASSDYGAVLGNASDGIFSGLGLYAVNATKADMLALMQILKLVDNAGKSDGIFSMWLYPKKLVTLPDGVTWDDDPVVKSVTGSQLFEVTVASDYTTIDGYTPKNKKLFQHPFNFLYVHNNNGGSAVYRYEKAHDKTQFKFRVYGSARQEAMCKLIPIGYKGVSTNWDESLALGNFPTCGWNCDTYKLWLAQNQNTQNLGMMTAGLTVAGGAIAAVAGLATANPIMLTGGVAAIGSGGSSIASTLSQRADHAIQPPQSRGQTSSNVAAANARHTFSFVRRSVDACHARIIDDYFTMYGYKTNRVKVPSIAGRKAFNYVKTIGCNISGNFAVDDIAKIKQIFDAGITFWKNGDKIGDYSVDNSL